MHQIGDCAELQKYKAYFTFGAPVLELLHAATRPLSGDSVSLRVARCVYSCLHRGMVPCFSLFAATCGTTNPLSTVVSRSCGTLPGTGLGLGVPEAGVLHIPDPLGCLLTHQSVLPLPTGRDPRFGTASVTTVYQSWLGPRTRLSCFSFAFPRFLGRSRPS